MSISMYRTIKFKKSFYPSAISLWNSLDVDIRNSTTLINFKLKVNKGPFIIYTRGWYRRDMGWVIKFLTSSWVG